MLWDDNPSFSFSACCAYLVRNRRYLLWGVWLLAVLVLVYITSFPHPASAAVATDTIVYQPVFPQCGDGAQRGTTAECPLYVVPGGPTPTINIYAVPVYGEDGTTQYMYDRRWSVADIAIVGFLAFGAFLGSLAYLTSMLRR